MNLNRMFNHYANNAIGNNGIIKEDINANKLKKYDKTTVLISN
jgi:hypothetical protein